MVYNVTINAHLTFEDKAAARLGAQAFELIAASAKHVGGGARIRDVVTGLDVSVHEPVVDRSKYVVGFQVAEESIRKYSTAVDKRAGGETDQGFWAELFQIGRSTGQVDFLLLTRLAGERLGVEDASGVVAEVIAEVVRAAAEREYKNAITPPKVRR